MNSNEDNFNVQLLEKKRKRENNKYIYIYNNNYYLEYFSFYFLI